MKEKVKCKNCLTPLRYKGNYYGKTGLCYKCSRPHSFGKPFIKGQVGWSKGTKGVLHNPLKGKKMPESWKAKLRTPKKIHHLWTDAQKKAQSERFMGKRMGAENARWKGGVSELEHGKIRRDRVRNAVGSYTDGEWELLKIQYGFTCPCCHQAEPIIQLTRDHIIPLSRGGSNFIENIQPLCKKCNVKKFTKTIKY
jgi:hypothetical protein